MSQGWRSSRPRIAFATVQVSKPALTKLIDWHENSSRTSWWMLDPVRELHDTLFEAATVVYFVVK